MRNALILIGMLLVTACAPQYPLNTHLNLQISPQGEQIYGGGATASIQGVDQRDNPEVVIYRISDPAVGITNLSPPHILIIERLAGGLRQQGLLVESSSPVNIIVEVKELLAEVTRSKTLYITNAASSVQLVLENRGTTLTKNYGLESSRQSLRKPKVDDLEELLNMQLSDIVNQILDDKKIQSFLSGE